MDSLEKGLQYGPTKLNNRLKMYKISDKVIKFIMEAMKKCKVELTAGGKTLAEVKTTFTIIICNSDDAILSCT